MKQQSNLSIFWLVYALLLSLNSSIVLADNHLKHYGDGPVKGSDFKKTPPNPLPKEGDITIKAAISTGIELEGYETDLEITDNPDGSKTVKVTPKKIVVNSIMDTSESWNSDPTNTDLLDHEQGHLDLAEQNTRKAQAEYNKKVKDGSLAGEEKTPKNPTNQQIQDAIDKASNELESEVNKIHDKHSENLENAHDHYDDETEHSSNKAKQDAHRKSQKQALAQVNTDDSKKKGPEAKSRSEKSLHFDSTGGLLSLDSDIVVGFDPLDSNFIADSQDPVLGAEVIFPSFLLQGSFEGGRLLFGAVGADPQIALQKGADTFFTTDFDYLFYDPGINLFYGVGGYFELLTVNSAFLDAMDEQLIGDSLALFGIEILPNVDFFALTNGFSEDAEGSYSNGFGARSVIPEPGVLALCLLGFPLLFWSLSKQQKRGSIPGTVWHLD